MATYTNVENVLHGLTAIPGVNSVSVDRTVNRLDSQADGARGTTMVGELSDTFSVTVETEDQGTIPAVAGLSAANDLTFDVQLDSASGTTLTHTITDLVCLGVAYSTNQDNPNGVTYTFEQKSTASAWSVA